MSAVPDRAQLERETTVTAFRAGGPGGQHRNKVETAIRITHVPTGITVVAADSRSQSRNRDIAFERLQARLAERARKRPARRPTKPSRASRKKRMDNKKRRSQIKHLRRRVSE